MNKRKVGYLIAFLLLAAIIGAAYIMLFRGYLGGLTPHRGLRWDAPSSDAVWPWPGVASESPVRGETHWRKTTSDGTDVELFRFDFAANPRLRFEMYDQDQDAPKPWTDRVAFYDRGVAQAAAHLDAIWRGKVIVATNGMFFNATGYGPGDFANHVSPVVVDGVPHYTGGENYRWTFGVKYIGGKPQFDAYHTPGKQTLATRFDFAAGAAQVLIWDGVAAASPAEYEGYDSVFEKMRTSRVAWGWSKDNSNLFLLFVKEPDAAAASQFAAKHHLYLGGDWMLADERHLFAQLGVWRPFNSDAGDVGQLIAFRPDGKYDLVPPKTVFPAMRLTLPATKTGAPDASGAPHAGSLMNWYVRETP